MHLRPSPQVYVKGDERRLAHYSVEARELREAGWVRESEVEVEAATPAPKVPESPETPEAPEVVDPIEPEPIVEDVDFEAMTRRELLQYAMDKGVDLPDNTLKADLIVACKAL